MSTEQAAGADWKVRRHRSRAQQVLIGVAVVVVVGLAVAGVVALRGGSGGRHAADRVPASATPSASAPADPLTVEAVEPSTPAPLPPPDRVRITAIGVDSPLETLDVDAAGALHAPRDFAQAGWFGKGPAPGDLGPAVIAGHVDSQRGPAVFYRLRDLAPGDLVEVSRGGQWIAFRVTGSERYPKNEFPTAKVYSPTPVPELRLITCGGSFDHSRRSYEDNIVVYALPAS